jgi:hypothetical protein
MRTCACACQRSASRALTRMESRLENSDSVVLYNKAYQQWSNTPCLQAVIYASQSSDRSARYQHTFNMCNSVVFPALSRPRNKSFACLFRRPREARVSQTVERTDVSLLSSLALDFQLHSEFWEQLLTPVDNPHLECKSMSRRRWY